MPGTSQGANNLYGQSRGLNRSVALTNLPTNGSTVYVRLWTRFAGGWQYSDTTYRASTTAAAAPGGGTTAAAKAALTSPTPGATLTGSTQTFRCLTFTFRKESRRDKEEINTP